METYRLNSKLVENNKEYIIQTSNDVSLGLVSTEVFVDGVLADSIHFPHPERIKPEEIMTLVQDTHGEKKLEIETLLNTIKSTLDSAKPETIYHLGLAFYYKHFYGEAKSLLQQTVAINSDFHGAYNHLSMVELALGNIDAALHASNKAIEMKPDYADYRNNLGEVYLSSGKYKNAIMEFKRAININLYYSDAYFNYGLTLLMNAIAKQDTSLFTDFMSKAHDYFTKSAIINQDYLTSDFEKGLAVLKEQKINESFQLLKRVRDNQKEINRNKSAAYYMKYIIHPNWITEESVVERINFLEKEIEKNPTYVDLYAELARCYLSHARVSWQKGIEQYKKTISINSSLTHVQNQIKEAEHVYDAIDHVMKKISE